jgi:hypothetical protein
MVVEGEKTKLYTVEIDSKLLEKFYWTSSATENKV